MLTDNVQLSLHICYFSPQLPIFLFKTPHPSIHPSLSLAPSTSICLSTNSSNDIARCPVRPQTRHNPHTTITSNSEWVFTPVTFSGFDKRRHSYPMPPASPSLHEINGVIHQLRHVVALLSQCSLFPFTLSSQEILRRIWTSIWTLGALSRISGNTGNEASLPVLSRETGRQFGWMIYSYEAGRDTGLHVRVYFCRD